MQMIMIMLITVDEIQIGIKRNEHSAQPRINHQQHDLCGTLAHKLNRENKVS